MNTKAFIIGGLVGLAMGFIACMILTGIGLARPGTGIGATAVTAAYVAQRIAKQKGD